MKAFLRLQEEMLTRLHRHLFPSMGMTEEAAFLLVSQENTHSEVAFKTLDMRLLAPEDFAAREGDYLELADGVRPALIKWAHDAHAGLIEIHSHPGPYKARFSPSDHEGLSETVPHMKWRLKGRSYTALVFSERDFDALVWLNDGSPPRGLDALDTGHRQIIPTNLSIKDLYHGK